MAVARLALHPDARLAVAGAGVAAAILLPLMTLFAIEGLAARASPPDAWIVEGANGQPFDAHAFATPPQQAVSRLVLDRPIVAYVVGAPGVASGHAVPMPAAPTTRLIVNGSTLTLDPQGAPGDLVSFGDTLVSPSLVPATATEALFLSSPSPADLARQNLVSVGIPGAQAYRTAGVAELRATTLVLVGASLPIVALVALGFGDLEAKSLSRTVATLSALGRPDLGSWIVAVRSLIVAAIGMGLATLVALAIYAVGPSAFHPHPFPRWQAVLAVALPGAVAWTVAFFRSRLQLPPVRLLRSPPGESEPPSRRVPKLRGDWQPILMGTRALPVMVLAALLFAVDLGFPLSAASVPGAVAGANGEIVSGNFDRVSDLLEGSTPQAPADALRFDPTLSGVLGEVLVPTTLAGHPVIVRGAPWDRAVTYYGLHLVEGGAPTTGIVLGTAVAGRLGLRVGHVVVVPATSRSYARALTVQGIFHGPSLLEDEGYTSLSTAQDLAGLPPGQVTLIRARPDSLEAMAALARPDAELVVIAIRHTPDVPVAGQVVRVDVELVNLGDAAGQRPLDIRLNGQVVDHVVASLGPYERGNVTSYVTATTGPFRIHVNPTQDVAIHGARWSVQTPQISYSNASITIRVVDGEGKPVPSLPVGVWSSLPQVGNRSAAIDVETTQGDGNATLKPLLAGLYTIGILNDTSPSTAPLVVADSHHRDVAWIVVENTFVDPPAPIPGEGATLSLLARNLGGAEGTKTIVVNRTDGHSVAEFNVLLQAGEETRLDTLLFADSGVNHLLVDGAPFNVTAGLPPTPVGGGPVPIPGPVRTSNAIQKQVADSVLSQARQALVAIGATAMVASLAVVSLAANRCIRGRTFALRALASLGVDGAALARRAAAEGAALGAAAGVAGTAATWILFLGASLGWPLVFGHRLPNPVGWAFLGETAATFATVCALAAYQAAASAVRDDGFVRREANEERLEPVTLHEWVSA
ncbi:MAG: hypothetical protein ACYDBQ_05160 [Thermoplasmatota archaeon]